MPSTVARQKSSLNILVPHQEDSTELESSDIPDPILPQVGDPNKTGMLSLMLSFRIDLENWIYLLNWYFASQLFHYDEFSGNTNGFKSHLEELSTLIIDNPSQESSMENQMVINFDTIFLSYT